jgi:hypothetical protein
MVSRAISVTHALSLSTLYKVAIETWTPSRFWKHRLSRISVFVWIGSRIEPNTTKGRMEPPLPAHHRPRKRGSAPQNAKRRALDDIVLES